MNAGVESYTCKRGYTYTCNARTNLSKTDPNGVFLDGLALMRSHPTRPVEMLVCVQTVFGWWTAYTVCAGARDMSFPADNEEPLLHEWLERCLDKWPGPESRFEKGRALPRHFLHDTHYIGLGVRLISSEELALVVREVPGRSHERVQFYDAGAVEVACVPLAHGRWSRQRFDHKTKVFYDVAMPRDLSEKELRGLYAAFDAAWELFMHKPIMHGQPQPQAVVSPTDNTVFALDKLLDGALATTTNVQDRELRARQLALYLERRALALRAQAQALSGEERELPRAKEAL